MLCFLFQFLKSLISLSIISMKKFLIVFKSFQALHLIVRIFLIGHLHCFLFVTQGITNACTMHKHQAAFENNVIYLSTLLSFALTYFSASCAFKISFCMLNSKRAIQQMEHPSLLLKIFGAILKIILDSSSSVLRP